MELTGKQRRYLRSKGQQLKPVVMIGRAGISDSVMREVDTALKDHELINSPNWSLEKNSFPFYNVMEHIIVKPKPGIEW